MTLSQSGLDCLRRFASIADHHKNSAIDCVIIQSNNKLTKLWDVIALVYVEISFSTRRQIDASSLFPLPPHDAVVKIYLSIYVSCDNNFTHSMTNDQGQHLKTSRLWGEAIIIAPVLY